MASDWAITLPSELLASLEEAAPAGQTAIVVGWDGQARGVVGWDGQARGRGCRGRHVNPTGTRGIAELRGLGLTPVLRPGGNHRAAHAVAATVGITDVEAEVLPWDKFDVVKRLQESGRVVAMVGDGVNGAAALAQADLGIAMGTGTDVAIEASDLTLVSGDLRAAGDAVSLSRRTLRTIKANLFWAFAYNVAAIPLAMTGRLKPIVAGAAMAFSSVFVVPNSLRLRRLRGRTPALLDAGTSAARWHPAHARAAS